MSTATGPDFTGALATHTVKVGPISGVWSCLEPCGATSIDNTDGVPTTRDEREAQHREHLVEVIEAEIEAAAAREEEAEALCDEELHSWDYFRPQQVDSYWMRCCRVGKHDEHEHSDTGATWSTT